MDMKTPQGFPSDLLDALGKILYSEQECPGVWYAVIEGNDSAAEEYCLVERTATCISDEAKAYGRALPHHPELLSFRLDDHQSGAGIVRYEIIRYLVRNGLPLPEGESLLSAAVFGMEDYPDYFGRYPAPRLTPHGFSTRWRELRPGVFSIETDRGNALLAVCYPLWSSCLPEQIIQLAEQTDYDQEHGIDNTFGYLFFPEASAHLILAELKEINN